MKNLSYYFMFFTFISILCFSGCSSDEGSDPVSFLDG
jgi:hypothetical protein